MTARSRIAKIERAIAQLEDDGSGICYVPVYAGESEAQALADFEADFGIAPDPGNIAFNHIGRGETRADSKRSGLHILYSIGPDTLEEILAAVDGCTRGIPEN